MTSDRDREDLKDVLEQFLAPSEAASAEQEIRAGERLLGGFPAPRVTPETLATIKRQIAAQLSTSPKPAHPFLRYVGAAAAVIVVALIGFLGRSVEERPGIRYASLISPAVWDSDDIVADDMELAYFRSELRRVEAQMYALEAGGGDIGAAGALDEVELELIRIERQFWKE